VWMCSRIQSRRNMRWHSFKEILRRADDGRGIMQDQRLAAAAPRPRGPPIQTIVNAERGDVAGNQAGTGHRWGCGPISGDPYRRLQREREDEAMTLSIDIATPGPASSACGACRPACSRAGVGSWRLAG
jgi:hypothetical protein